MDKQDVEDMIKDLEGRGRLEDVDVYVVDLNEEEPEVQEFERVYALFAPEEVMILKGFAEAYNVPVSLAVRLIVVGFLGVSVGLSVMEGASDE